MNKVRLVGCGLIIMVVAVMIIVVLSFLGLVISDKFGDTGVTIAGQCFVLITGDIPFFDSYRDAIQVLRPVDVTGTHRLITIFIFELSRIGDLP